MNNKIMEAMGLTKEVELVKENSCPFCAKEIILDNFRDELSKKEYRVSGLCQECQDKIFGL